MSAVDTKDAAAAKGASHTVAVEGPCFEDFTRGQEFDAPAVTLTAGHAALYQAMFGDRMRLPLDHESSRRVTGLDAPLAHPMLAINIAIGQSTWASQRVKANLFYHGLVMQRPVCIGDTLHTRTKVVALRQNRRQEGRAATGVVALEMTTLNQRGEEVLHFWRCPMIPCRDPEADTGHADDLDAVGASADLRELPPALTQGWNLEGLAERWGGLGTVAALEPGTRLVVESRDTITLAPELVRMTLNMAMAHTDARLSYLGERLVYGGHTISMAFAQATRALPNLLALVAWEGCDHTAPVVENDRLRSEIEIVDVAPLPTGGSLLRLRIESYAARGKPEEESRVLDWRLVVLSA